MRECVLLAVLAALLPAASIDPIAALDRSIATQPAVILPEEDPSALETPVSDPWSSITLSPETLAITLVLDGFPSSEPIEPGVPSFDAFLFLGDLFELPAEPGFLPGLPNSAIYALGAVSALVLAPRLLRTSAR